MKIKLLLILFFTLICSQPALTEEQLQVGVILPLTGPLSIQGVPMKNAMLLAKEQTDLDNRIKLIFEDDQFIPRNSVAAATKLIRQNNIDALAIFGTNQGKAVVEITEREKIPLLSINVNRSAVKNKNFAVLMMPAVEDLTAANLTEATKRKYKSIAIIATQQDSCLLQQKIFIDSKLFEIVYAEEIAPNELSVREHALKMISKNPDAIFLSVIPPQGSLLAKSLRELGYSKDIFGGLQIANVSELEASMGALKGAWAVAGDDRSAKKFFSDYKKRFNNIPSSESIYAYEVINLLSAALKNKKQTDLIAFLKSIKNFKGSIGEYSADAYNGYTFKVLAKEFTGVGFKYLNE